MVYLHACVRGAYQYIGCMDGSMDGSMVGEASGAAGACVLRLGVGVDWTGLG